MEKAGVKIYCDMKATSVAKEGEKVVVSGYSRSGEEHTFEAEKVFVATGSAPNVEGMGLESIGVSISKWGIKTNSYLQTTVPHIFACGDVVGALTLSRVAYYHAKTVVLNLLKKAYETPHKITYSSVGKVIFSIPVVAAAGMTEQEAFLHCKGKIKVYRCPYSSVEKACIDRCEDGLAKFICDQNGIVKGVHVLGMGAGEIVDAVEIGIPFSDLALEEMRKIRTSPSYYDVIAKMSYLCRNDLRKVKEGFLTICWKHLTSLFFNREVQVLNKNIEEGI